MKQMFKNLLDLKKCVNCCTKCELCKNRNNVVFGNGNTSAKLMFIAEAPGFYEDKTGKTFVGKSGKIIDNALKNLNLNRDDIYISNIVKCRPPQNRKPLPNEINMCLDYLRNQVILIKPKVIVLLGSVALKCILGETYSITKCRGQIIEKRGIKYIPTFHPSFVLRDNTKEQVFYDDIKKAVENCKN